MFFEKKVNRRKKEGMVRFLTGHYRYYTIIDSINKSTSYANCVKIYRLGLTGDQIYRAYDMLDTDFWEEIQWPIDNFTVETDGKYTIGVNGRSDGYLVLYRGKYYDPGYKSYCRACGQLNYTPVEGEVGECGKCLQQERVNLQKPLQWYQVLPSGIDDDMDWDDMMDLSMSDLREKVDLVCLFDRTCDEIRDNFIYLLDNCKVIEETVMVPKQVRRIVCAAEHT